MLRIIGGKFKGRKIYTVKTRATRPISARVKKSLFDILGEKVKGARFLDLFAGTGAVGIEAISRGAKEVTFIDKGHEQIRCLRRNLELLKMEGRIYRRDILKGLHFLNQKFDIVFVAPPYGIFDLSVLLKIISEADILNQDSTVILQHSKREKLNDIPFKLVRQETYGDTVLSFMQPAFLTAF